MERHILLRVYEIDRILRRKEYPNCTKLKKLFFEHHGLTLSIRTILRDIDAMRFDIGAPIAFDREKNGYYYEDDKFALPAMRLSEGELIAVYLGTEILKTLKNTPFEDTVRKAFAKIELLLQDSVSINFKEIGHAFSFDIGQPLEETDKRSLKAFGALTKAINKKNSAEVVYYSIGSDTTQKRVLDPYHLRCSMGKWYLVAYCHKRKDVRTFSVNQIKEIKLLKENFEVQKGFSANKFFADSWRLEEGGELTKVVVKIDKKISRWFAGRKLHPSQQTKKNKDGSLTLSFKVAGTGEIKRWILSQGSMVRVIEPGNLRKEIKEEARRILGL